MKNVAKTICVATICSVVSAQDRDVSDSSTDQVAPRTEFVWLNAPEGRIGGRAYINIDSEDEPVLAIVLHGDLLQPDNSYHYGFARAIAAQSSDVVVVGLLRPGYSDERGNRSDGEVLNATGDNYTAEVVEAVASATMQMKKRYGTGATILVGHSGGAAIAALVLGLYPDVADAALLVACPCDLPAWRADMMSVRPNPVWQQAHQGLSPLATVSGVRPTSIVELIVGGEDDVVRAEYSQDYAAALQERGIDASVTVLPGLGHNILQRPPVISMAKALLRRIQTNN
jgi:pimeloyl-ACP methyl ester carboxylesterase